MKSYMLPQVFATKSIVEDRKRRTGFLTASVAPDLVRDKAIT